MDKIETLKTGSKLFLEDGNDYDIQIFHYGKDYHELKELYPDYDIFPYDLNEDFDNYRLLYRFHFLANYILKDIIDIGKSELADKLFEENKHKLEPLLIEMITKFAAPHNSYHSWWYLIVIDYLNGELDTIDIGMIKRSREQQLTEDEQDKILKYLIKED